MGETRRTKRLKRPVSDYQLTSIRLEQRKCFSDTASIKPSLIRSAVEADLNSETQTADF
jgi:hypothetical protein